MKPVGFDGQWYEMPCMPVRILKPPAIGSARDILLRDKGQGVVLRDKVGNLDLVDGNIVLSDHPGGIRLRYCIGPQKFLTGRIGDRIGWIRIFGWGIRWKDLRCHSLVFSEREGCTAHLEIGHWSFGPLVPERAWRQMSASEGAK